MASFRWLSLFRVRKKNAKAPAKGRRPVITKDMIGGPADFVHVSHFGKDTVLSNTADMAHLQGKGAPAPAPALVS